MFQVNYERELAKYNEVVSRKNSISDEYNGIYDRYVNPVLTREHAPLHWRYDLNPKTNPYFMDSPEQLERALLKNEITIYIGTRNGEIKIYSKGGGVRYELSARKTILRKMMRDRRLCVLRNPLVLQTLFQNAAQRIGEIFAHSSLHSLFLRAAEQAIRNFWHGFSSKASEYGILPIISPYNNVVVIYAVIPQEQERPPPFALMASRIRKQQMPILGRCLLLSCAQYMLRNRNK